MIPTSRKAYLNYARRRRLDVSSALLEPGDRSRTLLLARDRAALATVSSVCTTTWRAALKKEFPEVQTGISLRSGRLALEQEAKSARSLIANSDYVGLSF